MSRHFLESFFLCLLISAPLYAEMGCMDNSYHAQQDYDYKQYHYVRCTCPCKNYRHFMSKGYRCSKCGHAHDPQIAHAIRTSYTAAGALEYKPATLKLFYAWPRKSCEVTPSCHTH